MATEQAEDKLDLIIKYAPKTLEDLKLPKRMHNLISEQINKDLYRLLLFGLPGTGKTTTAKLISKGHDVLYLSGSNDFNVEVMRQKIYPFCSNHSVLNKTKTIIIDEAENMSNKIQDAFKIVLDNSKSVNFIFITNEIEKMNTAVRSRCVNIEYNYQGNEIQEQTVNYVTFLKRVAEAEKISFTPEGLKQLYKINFPDFRHLLVTMQQIVDSKQSITVESVNNISESGIQNIPLYEALDIADSQKFYEICSSFKGQERECLIALGEPYFKYLNSKGKFEQTIKASIIVSKYCNQFVTTITKFGTFFGCMSELRSIMR